MEKDKFYKLVENMRIAQLSNANKKLSLSELLEQWQIEFLVDEELFRHSEQKSKVSKKQVTFAMFSNQYCPN